MTVRDRVVGLVEVKASKLIVNKMNPRTHSDDQRFVMGSLLTTLGMADALIARKVKGGKYELLDGHLRANLAADDVVPVLVVDLSDEEAELFMLTFDPVGSMAKQESGKFSILRAKALGLEADIQETLRNLGLTINAKSSRIKKSGDAQATRNRNASVAIASIQIPVTPDEAAELTLLMDEYGKANGSFVGFGAHLLRLVEDEPESTGAAPATDSSAPAAEVVAS